MYFQRLDDAYGDYTDKGGERCSVLQARRVRPADGWMVFETLDECLAAWELTYDPLPLPVE